MLTNTYVSTRPYVTLKQWVEYEITMKNPEANPPVVVPPREDKDQPIQNGFMQSPSFFDNSLALGSWAVLGSDSIAHGNDDVIATAEINNIEQNLSPQDVSSQPEPSSKCTTGSGDRAKQSRNRGRKASSGLLLGKWLNIVTALNESKESFCSLSPGSLWVSKDVLLA